MGKVIFDYSKLKGRIYEIFGSLKKFEEAMGISHTSLYMKLNNQRGFNQSEIQHAVQLLGIDPGSVSAYFFTLKLKKC